MYVRVEQRTHDTTNSKKRRKTNDWVFSFSGSYHIILEGQRGGWMIEDGSGEKSCTKTSKENKWT